MLEELRKPAGRVICNRESTPINANNRIMRINNTGGKFTWMGKMDRISNVGIDHRNIYTHLGGRF